MQIRGRVSQKHLEEFRAGRTSSKLNMAGKLDVVMRGESGRVTEEEKEREGQESTHSQSSSARIRMTPEKRNY